MPTYVLPQVLVFQDFRIVPAAAANPLRAHISGPHAFLIRYAITDERSKGRLGFYDRLLDTKYIWPNRPAGGKIDFPYVKLWMEDALLKYFEDTIGAASTITKVGGFNNRIRSATVNFAKNTDTYPRSTLLLDRDVKVGDVAKVRGIKSDGNSQILWTSVKRIIGEIVASIIKDATTDTNNPASQAASVSFSKIAGADNCVTLNLDDTSYDGLPSGKITETYDLLVLQGSVSGDFTKAKVRVISGSGTDDVLEVTPSADGIFFTVGTRGLRVAFVASDSAGCSLSAADDMVSPDDLIVGQRWQIVVNDDFTKPVPTSAGTYTGKSDTTYIVEITRGGLYTSAIKPQISVTTTNGVDLSGPHTVSVADTLVSIGTLGTQIKFSGLGLRKGDRYYVEVLGEKEGPMRILELSHNLDVTIATDSEVDLTLYILKPLIQIEKNRTGFAPLVNWETSETEITVKSGIIAFDSTWTSGGVAQPLDVHSESSQSYGELFVEYRAWLADLCNTVNALRDAGEINAAISGALHPDNPLKWGVFKALENSNGTEVKFTSVCNPDKDTDWARVLELLLGRDDVYELVPLTRRRTVLDLYAAHVKDQSAPEQGLWRVLWTNLEGVPAIPVVAAGSTVPGHILAKTSDGLVALGLIEDDPQTSGTQYTILRNTNANATFIKNGVRAGDLVRALYTGDGFGNFTYSEFIVDQVQAEDQIRLLTGPGAPVTVPAKFEIWRNLTPTEEAKEIGLNAGSWGDRRIRAVWPDTIESSGTIMDGIFLCCSLAGLTSGVLPHQGLTNLEIVGYTRVDRTAKKFNRSQLDSMAVSGVWIVTQDLIDGQIFSRHAVTTGPYDDLNKREEMLTRNVDSISYRFKDHFAPFIGVTNVTPIIQERLELEVGKLTRVLQTESETQNLGGQLIDATIVELRPSPAFKDRFILRLNLDVPEPFNNLEVHLLI